MLISRRLAAVALVPLEINWPVSDAPNTQPPGRANFPNVVLLNQDSKRVRFYDDLILGNHTVVINFIYAQCGDICPTTMANLANVQELLGERLGRTVFMASISIDPLHDYPVVLKAYGENFNVRAGWQLFTGKPNDIERIRRQLGVYDRDPEKDQDLSQHTGMLVYGNQARGHWSRVSALANPRRIFESITRWT